MSQEQINRLIRKRPLLFVFLFFAGGITLGYYVTLTSLLTFIIINLLLALILIIYFMPEKSKVSPLLPPFFLCFLTVLLAGFLWINWQELKYQSRFSTVNFNDQGKYQVLGEIVVRLNALQGNRLYLKPYYLDGFPIKYGLVQLEQRFLPGKLKAGDVIKAGLVLKTPHQQLNPGGFCSYRYLKKNGIYSRGYLEQDWEKVGERKIGLNYLLIKLKERLLTIIELTIDQPYQQLLGALLLGERADLPQEWRDNFSKIGLNHLLAISGLHVGFIVIIFRALLQPFQLKPVLQNSIISLLLVLYIMLTGFRPAIIRAGLLALAFFWAPVFKRSGDIYNLLGLTAIINLLFNPYELFNPGFQLSYLILVMIINWYWLLKDFLPSPLAVSVAAQLGSMPITAYYFNSIALSGIVANIWAIPLTGLIVSLAMSGLLLSLINPVFGWLVNRPVYLLSKLMVKGVELMAAFPYGFFEVAAPAVLNCLFLYLFLLFFPFFYRKKIIPLHLTKRKRNFQLFSVAFLLFLLLNLMIPLFNNQLEVIFLAVGQGDSVFIDFPSGQTMLVDGGGMAGYDSSQGKRSILPFLKKRGIKKLDLVFITHFDTDHALGITDLLQDNRVGRLIVASGFERNQLAEKVLKLAAEKGVKVSTVQAGDRFQFNQALLQVLNPERELPADRSRNENSIVLKLTYRNFSMLLTGDLEREGENRLLEQDLDLYCQILKLGHHGSSSSSSLVFLQRISPREGIISVGKNNYGHPAAAVLERAEQLGIRIWRTDQQGAIMIRSNGFSYQIRGFRRNSNERNILRSFRVTR